MAFDFPASPTLGQTYQVTGGPTYVWNGTAWQVLTPGSRFNRQVYTATAGQTTFNATYLIGGVDVFHNGVKLAPADFTASNGSTVVLISAANAGDTIEIVSYSQVNYTNAVQKTGDTMTGNLTVVGTVQANSASYPLYQLYNSGIATNPYYRIAYDVASNLVFQNVNAAYTVSTEQMRIDASGNVGIGQTPTSYGAGVRNVEAYIAGASAFTLISANTASVKTEISASESSLLGQVGTRTNHPFLLKVNDAERMRITTAGNVGIGAGSPPFRLVAANSTTDGGWMWSFGAVSVLGLGGYAGPTDGAFQLRFDRSIGDAVFYNGQRDTPTERARLTVSGDFLVGSTSSNPIASRVTGIAINPTFMTVNGASNGMAIGFRASSGSSIAFYTDNGSAFVAAGNISSNGSSTSYNTSSDYRLKENLRSLTGSLNKLTQVRLVSFDWKEGYGEGSADGVIAHELAEIFPLAVNGDKDAVEEDGRIKPQGVDYSKLVPYLIDAIQEQQKQIEALTARIAQLEGTN